MWRIVTLDSPLYPNQRRPIRVDEDGIEVYPEDELRRVAQLGRDRSAELAQAGVIGWDEATRMVNDRRSNFPTNVNVDASCDTIPAARDPLVQKAALDALRRSVKDEAAGTAEHGFYASKNILSDGYSVGPTFSTGHHDRMILDQVARRKLGLARSLGNGTYPPSLFVHAHPNNKPPSPISSGDRNSANALDIPIAAIDKDGNLYCAPPKRK